MVWYIPIISALRSRGRKIRKPKSSSTTLRGYPGLKGTLSLRDREKERVDTSKGLAAVSLGTEQNLGESGYKDGYC